MPSSPSEFLEETLKGEPSAPPTRYPLSARHHLLSALRQRPRARDNEAPTYALARSRRMQRSARSLLWWVPFWYAIAQLLLFVWMDERWQLNRTRVENDKWKQLHVRLAEAPDRPLVLMLGSSRTDWAFQAGRMNGQPGPDGRPLLVYNFGIPTTGPLHEALYVNDLLNEGIRPRLLLIELVTTHFNQARRAILSEERFTQPEWISAHQLNFFSPYFSNPRRALTVWLQACVAPWYGYRWSVHEHLLGHHATVDPLDQALRPMDSWGWRVLCDDPGTPEYRALRWTAAANMYVESLQQFRLGAKPVQAMHDLLARCRREHIAVALVLMPVTKEFSNYYSAEGKKALAGLVAQLRDSYGVELIDASDWLDREDFDDGHHVLKGGASKFTNRMIGEVQKLLARNNPPEQVSFKP